MENLIFLLATSFVLRLSAARKFKNKFIGDTGCSALLAFDEELESSITSSGDRLYFHEFRERKVNYGMICVQMDEQYDMTMAVEMLTSYMDSLRGTFFILHNTGIHPAADWNNDLSRSFEDYWQDMQKRDWKIKGYTDGRTLAILYVKNISHVDVKKQELFLDSFHFKPVVPAEFPVKK
jgi:hypothetical protein